MKSFISFFMALVMAFACIGCVSAEEQSATSVEVTVKLDREELEALPGTTEESKQQIEFFSDLLDVLKLNMVIDGQALQIDLMAEDDKVLTLAGKKDGKDIVLASSLLGNNVIQIAPEKVAQLMQSAGGSGMPQGVQGAGSINIQEIIETVKGLDMKKVGEDLTASAQDFTAKFQAKIGEPETGTFEVDGMTFTVKIPINMSYDELIEMALTFVKDIVSKESIAPLMKVLAKDEDVGAAMDKKIEEIKNTPEDQKPSMEMALYSNEGGDGYFVLGIIGAKQEDGKQEVIHVGSGKVGGTTIAIVNCVAKDGGTFDMNMTATEENKFDMTAKVDNEKVTMDMEMHAEPGLSDTVVVTKIEGMEVKTQSHVTVNDNGGDCVVEYFYNGSEKAAVTVNAKASKGGEITAKFEGDDVKVIPIEKLMNQEDSAVGQLAMEVMGQLTGAVTTLKNHLPEASGNILISLFSQGNK